MSALLMLIPPEYAVFMFLAAGIAFIVQAKRIGAMLVAAGAATILIPPLIAPLLSYVPLWVLLLLLVAFVGSIGRAVLNLIIGRAAGDHAVGVLAADVIRHLFVLPFRLVGGLLTLLFRRGAP